MTDIWRMTIEGEKHTDKERKIIKEESWETGLQISGMYCCNVSICENPGHCVKKCHRSDLVLGFSHGFLFSISRCERITPEWFCECVQICPITGSLPNV